MRWTYLIPRFIIIAAVWAFMAFAVDPLLRYSAVQTAQSVTGARADIVGLETGFFPPVLSLNSVALASHRKPGTNLLEFEEMRLRLAGTPLLRKSFVVDEASVTGVRFGTSRNDNGQLDIEETTEPSEPSVPPWLTDKLQGIGDEWLEELTRQAKQQLDPNTLESYRVGNELYVKWDTRFRDVNERLMAAKVELDSLKQQIDDAKSSKSLEQIEKYLQVAQRADLLMRESRALLSQFKSSVPLELRNDFTRLDQAQQNDRARAVDTIQMLKPDACRITESLIGEEMYRQLQQLLTWVELLRGYQQDLRAPAAPERSRGRDIEFALLNPTPRMLVRKMLINGELMLSDIPTPFEATLTDVTSDPKMHGRPALLHVTTRGETPVELVVRHDATKDISATDVGVDYIDRKSKQLAAGKADGDHLLASLSNMHWTARLTLIEDGLSGRIDLSSEFGQPEVRVRHRLATSLATLTEDSLGGISTVRARVQIQGTIRHPEISVTSDLGEQIAAGFDTAFAAFVPQLKQQLTAELTAFVDQQKQEFSSKYGARYAEVLEKHQNIIDGLDQAHQLAMDLRSGNVDPDKVFRLASESGLLKDKDQQKVEKYRDKSDEVIKGLQNPQQTIQDALPGLRKKLFR